MRRELYATMDKAAAILGQLPELAPLCRDVHDLHPAPREPPRAQRPHTMQPPCSCRGHIPRWRFSASSARGQVREQPRAADRTAGEAAGHGSTAVSEQDGVQRFDGSCV